MDLLWEALFVLGFVVGGMALIYYLHKRELL